MPVHVSRTRVHRQEVKLYYTASGIVTSLGGNPVHSPPKPVHRTTTYSL